MNHFIAEEKRLAESNSIPLVLVALSQPGHDNILCKNGTLKFLKIIFKHSSMPSNTSKTISGIL